MESLILASALHPCISHNYVSKMEPFDGPATFVALLWNCKHSSRGFESLLLSLPSSSSLFLFLLPFPPPAAPPDFQPEGQDSPPPFGLPFFHTQPTARQSFNSRRGFSQDGGKVSGYFCCLLETADSGLFLGREGGPQMASCSRPIITIITVADIWITYHVSA